ncbi:MAG: sterol desaturase family protein [Acidobacteria bacterium]|nr:sterol desaturase family protein [Acidobacteriota bacterium]
MEALVIVLAIPVFFAMFAVEAVVAQWQRRSVYRLDDTLSNLSLGLLSQVAGVFTRVLTVGVYAVLFEHARVATLPASHPLVWVGALVAYDFCYYWQHRLGHERTLLWAAHVVHHQSEHYNLSTALRQTSSGWLLGWMFYMPLAVAGVPPSVFAVVALIDLLYQFWVHTELVGSLGWFDRWFASPSNHRVHHAVNDRYLDRNYGGIFMVWDHLFGTFVDEDAAHPPVYGTRAPLRSWNPAWANAEVYAGLVRELRAAPGPGAWWQVLTGRTGWHLSGAGMAPAATAFSLDRAAYDPRPSRSLLAYGVVQYAVLAAGGVQFLVMQPGQSLLNLAPMAMWIAVSLSTLGMALDNRPSGMRAERARLMVTALGVAVKQSWFLVGPIPAWAVVGVVVAALLSAVWVGKSHGAESGHG